MNIYPRSQRLQDWLFENLSKPITRRIWMAQAERHIGDAVEQISIEGWLTQGEELLITTSSDGEAVFRRVPMPD